MNDAREHGYNDAKYGFTYVSNDAKEYALGMKDFEIEKRGIVAGTHVKLNAPIAIHQNGEEHVYQFADFGAIVEYCTSQNDYIVTVKLADGKYQYTYLSECLTIR